jgi:hypothetical protein
VALCHPRHHFVVFNCVRIHTSDTTQSSCWQTDEAGLTLSHEDFGRSSVFQRS